MTTFVVYHPKFCPTLSEAPYFPWSWAPTKALQDTKNNCYDFGMNDFSGTRGQKSEPGERARLPPPDKFDCQSFSKGVLRDNPGRVRGSNVQGTCPLGASKVLMLISKTPNEDFHFVRQVLLPVNLGGPIGQKLLGLVSSSKSVPHPNSGFRMVPLTDALENALSEALPKVPEEISPTALPPPGQPAVLISVFAHKRGWSVEFPLFRGADGRLLFDPTRKSALNYGEYNYEQTCPTGFCVFPGAKTGRTGLEKDPDPREEHEIEKYYRIFAAGMRARILPKPKIPSKSKKSAGAHLKALIK